MELINSCKALIIRACILKPRSILLPSLSALIFFPAGNFLGITVGAMLGGGWASEIGEKMGVLIVPTLGNLVAGLVTSVLIIIGSISGYCVAFILIMVFAINVGNTIGYLLPLRREVIRPSLTFARFAQAILVIIMMHGLYGIVRGIHHFATQGQRLKASKALGQRYQEARGDHARVFYLEVKETLEEKVDPLHRDKASIIIARLEKLVNVPQRDQEWFKKYFSVCRVFYKAKKDNHISAEELSKIEEAFERESELSILQRLSIELTKKMLGGMPPIGPKIGVGGILPDFTFQNIQEGLPPITQKDLQGKPSVLVFWAKYDTPWSKNFKVAHDLYNQREALNINIFAIAVDESKDDVKRFLGKHPTDMPVYHDPNSNYEHRLDTLGSVEQVIIVDSMTKIQFILKSADSVQEIKEALDKIER